MQENYNRNWCLVWHHLQKRCCEGRHPWKHRDYAHTSATLWLNGRYNGVRLKWPSFLPFECRTREAKINIWIWAVPLSSSGGHVWLCVFSPTCRWMTSSETSSPLTVGFKAPRMISRRLRPVAAENWRAWREGSSLPYLKETRKQAASQPFISWLWISGI